MSKETATELARKCTTMARKGRSFPTVWRAMLKRHILVGGVPRQRFEDKRTLVDIPLTTGERLVFDREGKEFRLEIAADFGDWWGIRLRRQRNGSSLVTKVLYVEDNDDNLYMLKMRLELLGDFEVLAAENGERGCEMAVTEQPDIILMDLEMPVLDGWEASRRLKSNAQTRDIPIIGLSAHALVGEREKALAAGCDEFDHKPVDFERLVATIRRVLARA